MTTVLVLALALSAFQVEYIIWAHYPGSDIQQVSPTSHPAVEYEWRIEGWEPKVFGSEETSNEVSAMGNRILDALGTSTTDSEWDFFGRLVPITEMNIEQFEEMMKQLILVRGKRDNVAFEWSVPEDVPVLRILVFDPAMISLYSEGHPE